MGRISLNSQPSPRTPLTEKQLILEEARRAVERAEKDVKEAAKEAAKQLGFRDADLRKECCNRKLTNTYIKLEGAGFVTTRELHCLMLWPLTPESAAELGSLFIFPQNTDISDLLLIYERSVSNFQSFNPSVDSPRAALLYVLCEALAFLHDTLKFEFRVLTLHPRGPNSEFAAQKVLVYERYNYLRKLIHGALINYKRMSNATPAPVVNIETNEEILANARALFLDNVDYHRSQGELEESA